MRRVTAPLLLPLLFVAVALAIWSSPSSPRPNVLLITVDTLRADRLSSYGYAKHETPNFDRLAHEGVLFENAFCDVTWTTPSLASVMTGRYATVHRLQSSYNRLRADLPTIAETLRASGYHTAAIVGSFPVHSIFGLNRGFVSYDETFSVPLLLRDLPEPPPDQLRDDDTRQMARFLKSKALHDAYRPDDRVSDRALRWLRHERREPFFLWLHYFGPHEKPHGTDNMLEERRLSLARYESDVLNADAQVGRVLEALDTLGLSRRTVVVLHADHGQSLLEHDYFGHGRYLFDDCQRVPLLLRLPDRRAAGTRVHPMVRNLDIFPTVLELAGVAPSGPLDGTSLLRALRHDGAPEEVYVETYLSATWLFADIDPAAERRVGMRRRGIRTPQWKLVANDPMPLLDRADAPLAPDDERRRYASEALYDLAADPGETRNVLDDHPEIAQALRQRLSSYGATSEPALERVPLDDAMRARLEALGYLE